MLRKFFSLLTVLLAVQLVSAQAPAGYYSSTKGASGRNLKTAMFKVIGNHKDIGYDGLWKAFRDTDSRPDGTVWDMYSNTTKFRFGTDQDKGRHSKEGDTYNREHSFPKSWFGDARPMHNDLFHLYPTDSYINGIRSNYAFGETDHPSKTSHNGFSKFGRSSVPGYSGDVFEPNDEYKGDFARSYFYMATAYEDRFSKFSSPMLARNSYPCYQKWALDMLLRWAKEDPVSEKEIKRNNAVYKHQKNRNPFIDFPGLEQYVWGDKQNVAFDPDNYNGGEVNPGPNPNPNPNPDVTVAAPVFSVASGQVAVNTEVTISSTTAGATIYYTVNSTAEVSGASPVKYTITDDATISAYAKLGDKKSETVTATYTIAKSPIVGNGVYVRVDNDADLTLGNRYLIVCEGEKVAMAEDKKDIRGHAEVTINGTTIETDVAREGKPYAFVLGRTAGHYTFCDVSNDTYLSVGGKNKLYSIKDGKAEDAQWNIELAAGIANISSVKSTGARIQYNSGSPRFAAYKSGQKPVALFKETVADAIEYPVVVNGTVNVYSIGGRLLRNDVNKRDAVKGLPRGIYIIGGAKVLVR